MLSYASVRLLLLLSLLPAAARSPITGTVLDESGRPLPRALVRVVAVDGRAGASTFTDVEGSFHLQGVPQDGCRIEASLPGFSPAAVPCSAAGTPVRLTLAVAPIAEQVVVSATRTEAPTGQIAASVTVFDSGEIARRQEPPLAELLQTSPGAVVVRAGAPGSVTSLFVRGGESNYTKVILDGIPLNEPGGAFNLSNITTDNLDRVEVVRGANSAVFGSDAMTGVIQLFTKRGTSGRPRAHVTLEAGRFATTHVSAGAAGGLGRWDYSGDVSRESTDNAVPNNAFRNLTLSGSAGARLGAGSTLRLIGRATRGRVGVPGQTAFGRPDLDAFFTRHDGVAGATLDRTGGAWHQRATYGVAASHQASTNLILDPPYTPSFEGRTSPFEFFDFAYDSRTSLRRHHATFQADRTHSSTRAGTHVETALVDWDGERATLTDALAGTATHASRDNLGLTLQHQALWSRVFVSAGVRIEHNGSFGAAFVPRAGAAWYLRPGNGTIGATRVSANAGSGIKEPTVLQSFSVAPAFLGNPELQPERARTLDAGLEQRLLRDRIRIDLTWFDDRYRNIISTRTTSFNPFRSQYFNVGLSRARGAELSGDVALVSGVRARAGYTFLDSKILESTAPASAVFKAGNAAFRRPRHSGFVSLSWTGVHASIDLTGTMIGHRVDSDFSSLEPPILISPGYRQWDLRANVPLAHTFAATLAVDNIADARYMQPLGFPALRRAARVGLRARF